MGAFKKNYAFSALIFSCLLVFAAGSYLALAEFSKISRVEKRMNRMLSDYGNLRRAVPAPTVENVAASTANVTRLQDALARIREDLQKGVGMTMATDGISVMTGIQLFISEFRQKASENRWLNPDTGETEAAPIVLNDDMAFGFEIYMDELSVPEEASVIPLLDKQRQILAYLMDRLFRSYPHRIESVRREIIEFKGKARNKPVGYTVDPAVTARVPGAIDTMAFRVQYTGYSDSLRQFLNALAVFEMPIVVRSIEVARAGGGTPEKKARTSWADDLSDGADESSSKAPVIEDNASTFTLILEFIEVILPFEDSPEKRGMGDA